MARRRRFGTKRVTPFSIFGVVMSGRFTSDRKDFAHVALAQHLEDIVDVGDFDVLTKPCGGGFALRDLGDVVGEDRVDFVYFGFSGG